MNVQVKKGTRWAGGDRKAFRVLDVVDLDGRTWVHYRNDDCSNPKEYSCYLESFVSRFSPIVNEARK